MSDRCSLLEAPARQLVGHPHQRLALSPCSVSLLSASQAQAWDGFNHRHPQGSLFHTLAWQRAVQVTYGHEPLYLVATRGDSIAGVLPLFLIRSRLTGTRLVSVPYATAGGCLADDEIATHALLNHAQELGQLRGAKVIELRSEIAADPTLPISTKHAVFRRELPATLDELPGWIPRKARAAARNGREKFGLTISYDDAHLDEVWNLYAVSMRRLGSINYPQRFFSNLLSETTGNHWVSRVQWQGRTVAGLVSFVYRDAVLPYFVGLSDAARDCSAANYIYYSLMERAVEHGLRVFDFGRTRLDNTGSYDFKRFFGFEPTPLAYQHIPLDTNQTASELSPGNPRIALARKLWSHLPLPVTKQLGAMLSYHLPG